MIKLVLTLLMVFYFPQRLAAQPLDMANADKKPLLMRSGPLSSTSDTDRFRTFILQGNKKVINAVNSDPSKTYKLEANAFAKLTQSEIRQRYLSLIPSSDASVKFAKTISKKGQKPVLQKLDAPQMGIAAAANSFNEFNAIRLRSAPLGSSFQRNVITYQNLVLEDVKKFLRKKNISNSTIQQKIIPSYKYQNNQTQHYNNRRMLQQNQGSGNIQNSPEELNQIQSQIQIKDVDWSCLSGRVKAQGDCGACYAFATADNVGALLAIYYYQFHVQLSIQQMIDCIKNSLVYGCDGGFLEGALAHFVQHGVNYQLYYPYSSLDLSKVKSSGCMENISSLIQAFTISDFGMVNKKDCEDLKLQLQRHPISIGISGYKLAMYKQGVFDGCSEIDDLDHAALLVGYKKGKGWKVKNSWGPRWGENGYVWLKDGNTCRLCEIGFYPIPAEQYGLDKYLINQKILECPPP